MTVRSFVLAGWHTTDFLTSHIAYRPPLITHTGISGTMPDCGPVASCWRTGGRGADLFCGIVPMSAFSRMGRILRIEGNSPCALLLQVSLGV